MLLLPPTPRDAEAIRTVLSQSGMECVVVSSIAVACSAMAEGAATLVVSEEALLADADVLRSCLRRQPLWADLPIVVLSRSGSESPRLTIALQKAGHVSVVERPVRVSTFLSVVRAALRSRERQYEVRDHLLRVHAIEAERLALWESERAARAEAERASRIKDEFLATLSHEIRTPLNAILGWAHILSSGTRSSGDLGRGLEVIERNARAQSQIIADLLDMSRITNGKIRLDVQRIELASLVQTSVDSIMPAADAKGIRLETHLETAGIVRGDSERLQQVFWNLLSNAVKFTPAQGQIRVATGPVGHLVEVHISDTGEGIPADFIPHLFDRFRQADGSTTRRHGGLGLGLSIVKQLVEMHGGTVRAESPGDGAGSTFIVSLPLAGDPPHPAGEAPSQNASGDRRAAHDPLPDISGLFILVIDDEPDARELVRRLLEDRSARVVTAASAREGLELLQQSTPDTLVSDIGMPGEDGLALIRRVRMLPARQGRDVPAIALTAYARSEERQSALRAGFQHHLAKPVDPDQLVKLIALAAGRIAH